MADGDICAACLHRLDSHTPDGSAACGLLHPLSAAEVNALRQDQLQVMISSLPSEIVFYSQPLAGLAADWFAAGIHPDWITGGTLFGLDDVGAKAVILQLVDQAPTTMSAEVQAFVALAVAWVRRVRSLLDRLGGGSLVAVSRPLLVAAARPSLHSSSVGLLPAARGAIPLTTPGGAADVSSSGLSAAFVKAGRTFSNVSVRAIFDAISASSPPLTYEGLLSLPGINLSDSVRSALSHHLRKEVEHLLATSCQAAGDMNSARERLLLPPGCAADQVRS
jgi:hypothetical protein